MKALALSSMTQHHQQLRKLSPTQLGNPIGQKRCLRCIQACHRGQSPIDNSLLKSATRIRHVAAWNKKRLPLRSQKHVCGVTARSHKDPKGLGVETRMTPIMTQGLGTKSGVTRIRTYTNGSLLTPKSVQPCQWQRMAGYKGESELQPKRPRFVPNLCATGSATCHVRRPVKDVCKYVVHGTSPGAEWR